MRKQKRDAEVATAAAVMGQFGRHGVVEEICYETSDRARRAFCEMSWSVGGILYLGVGAALARHRRRLHQIKSLHLHACSSSRFGSKETQAAARLRARVACRRYNICSACALSVIAKLRFCVCMCS